MSSLGWGIMAAGGIAGRFAADLALDGHRLAAIGSRDGAKARAFAERFGVSKAHGSYEAVATDPSVDIVYVATPHNLHLECALMAINAGKAVLVEKPLTMNAAQARIMEEAARAAGVACMEAMWTRFLPHMAHLREILDQGLIGRVTGLIVDHNQDLPRDPHHRINDPELGGGALLDLGIYPISFAYELFGQPNAIESPFGVLGPTGVDRQVSGVFTYGGPTPVTYWLTASDLRGPNRASVVGAEGRVDMDPVWYTPTQMRTYGADGVLLDTFNGATAGRGMQFEAREMERLVKERRLTSQIMPLSQSVEIMETLDQIRAAVGVVYPADAE
ncbi:MAG: Gfo/Idh/MocA family oxidoreductase [Bifidobacteriaceae bacterium]|jgi:predicted dehydrogenase|nr:Gfo/Idh/MocA family oxidoreductase [Bifidobacteriaceae bacterium]